MTKTAITSNLIFSMMSVVSSAASSFLLVPLYTSYLGISAYGYVALGLSLVNISTVLSLAITSMASRFIVVALRKEPKKADLYFSTIVASCIIVAILVMCLFLAVCSFLPIVITIENSYLDQMKILLLFQAGSLALSIASTPFIASQYYKDDLRLLYGFTSASQLARVIVPYVVFSTAPPTLWLPFLSSFIVDAIAFMVYIAACKRLMPMVAFRFHAIKSKIARELVSSGCWVSLNKAGSVLLTTVSNYMSNIFVGVQATGIFASFSQLQSFIAVFTNAIVGCFVPRILAAYSHDNASIFMDLVANYTRYVALAVGFFSGVAVVLAVPFFYLWIGEGVEPYKTCITVLLAYLPFAYPVEVLNQVLIAQNRVRIPALVTIAFGILNVVLIFVFCLELDWGITGIALAQMITSVLRAWSFYPVYVARQNRSRTLQIYRSMLFGPMSFFAAVAITFGASSLLSPINTWLLFISSGTISIFVCGSVALLLFTNSAEKKLLIGNMRERIR